MTTTMAIRLDEELIEEVDRWVDKDGLGSRSELVRAALRKWLHDRQEAEIDRNIIEAYTRFPQTDEELGWARAATIAMIEEEPW